MDAARTMKSSRTSRLDRAFNHHKFRDETANRLSPLPRLCSAPQGRSKLVTTFLWAFLRRLCHFDSASATLATLEMAKRLEN